MQKYLVLFIAILLLCTWIVDQYLITTVQANMLEQTRDGLEQVASPLIKKLTDAPVLDDLEELEKLLDSHDKSPTIQYDIINSVGQILATTDPLIKMETSNNQSEKPEVINARNNVTFTVSGEKSFWTQKIDVGDQLGFFVRTSQNNTVISETTSTIRRSIWLMSLVVGLVGATLFILFSRTSLQPLYDFTNVARQIATGKYDAALSLQGREENWVMLSEAFRHMQDELEKREVNILDNNARLQAVLSSMIEGVLAINSSGQVMLANGAACEMLQLSHADVQGRQFIEIFRIPELTAAIETTQKDRSFSKCEFQTRELPRKIISARVSVLSETAERKRPG
ncbi:MAG: PAS domain-containing protein, partial [Planctomycetota bacterium]